MKVAIIGAGVAGMTAAYALSKKNIHVDVYEASDRIGGMAATISLWNQKVDIGPHRFFSNDKLVNNLWLEVVGKDYEMVNRLTRIFYDNNFYNYPLKINDTLSKLGLLEAGHCMMSYLLEKMNPTAGDGAFESWVQRKFGKRLYSIFFKTYSEKLWGIPCKELDSDFAAQRINKLSLYEAVKNAILKGKGNKHKTLVDQFAYPIGGTGMVYERMADAVKRYGNHIFLNTPVHKVVNENNKVVGIELRNSIFKEYDHVVSTMPYTTLLKGLTNVPAHLQDLVKKLHFRNTIIVYLLVNAVDVYSDNWIYIHSSELRMGRITNFRNWVPQLYNDDKKTILAIEYWCNDDEPLWKANDDELIELATSEVVKTGLIQEGLTEAGYIHRISKSYPVYNKGYKQILQPINQYLTSLQNLSVIGRYGAFKYNNQDHSILMGLKAADNIAEKATHDLFEINTDYVTYQESYIITATGLQQQ